MTAETYQPKWTDRVEPFTPDTHEKAMDSILRCAGVSTLSYEEAIAVYLRARGILRDEARVMAEPIPEDWSPPQGAVYAPPTWRVLSSPAGDPS